MKKRLLCVFLVFAMLFPSATAVFSDIQGEDLLGVTSFLDALGIMQGMGDGTFQPRGQLTRAQFCKIALTSLGANNVDAYKNYTIFPDVKTSHWASSYVNSAIRHPEVKEYKIIRGYTNGTFLPDNAVRYGEACTMIIRMMGYTQEDVGLFWPSDYMTFAKALGILDGLGDVDAAETVSRQNAAFMIYHALYANCKDRTRLIDHLVAETVEDSVLVAISETCKTLSGGKAAFYESGHIIVRTVPQTITKQDVGAIGTIYMDRNASSRVIAFLPGQYSADRIKVSEATETAVQAQNGATITPGYTVIFDNRTGTLVSYKNIWQDIQVDHEITCVYNDMGYLKMMIVF